MRFRPQLMFVTVATVALLVVSSPVRAADKKATSGGQKAQQIAPSAAPQVQIEYMNTLAGKLSECRTVYLADQETLKSNLHAAYDLAAADAIRNGRRGGLTQVEIVDLRQSVLSKFKGMHKVCIERASEEFSGTAKVFVDGFSPSLQTKAKELLAQWMTALEATSTDAYDSEASKFKTVANQMKLELALK